MVFSAVFDNSGKHVTGNLNTQNRNIKIWKLKIYSNIAIIELSIL